MNLAKSHKWRERQKAYVEGRLPEWEAAQAEKAPAPATPPVATPVPYAPSGAYESPEAAAWRAVYSGAEAKQAVSWPEGQRYPRWLLQTNADRRTARDSNTHPHNF